MIHHNDQFVATESETFFHTLFHKLDAQERIELRFKLPSAQQMQREFCVNPEEAINRAIRLANSYDMYVGAAPRLGEVGTKEGVTRLLALWGDLDVKGEHTKESRVEQLKNLSCPPSMLVWSGGGYHPYWMLMESVQGSEELARAEKIMQRIAESLDGDAVYDRSRILRIPGTLNHKLEDPRPVRLVHHDPGLRYTLDQLEEMVESFPKLEDSEKGKTRCGKVPKDVLNTPVPKDKRNVTLTSVAGSLRERGLDEGTITVVLLEVNRLRCVPPLGEVEAQGIARSVSRYPAGTPRYMRSSAKRVHPNGEAR